MSRLRVIRRITSLLLALVLLAPGAWGASAAPTTGLDNVVALVTNSCKSLVARADGSVWGWGCNSDWDLGATDPGGALLVTAPIQATGLDQVRGIAAGIGHGLGVRADGTVWAWGENDYGQVGVPPGEDCPHHPRPCAQTPVAVPGLSGVKAVAAGDYSSVVLKADGTVWAWGDGRLGALGLGTTDDVLSPTQVAGLDGIAALSAIGTRVVALGGDGAVWGWGGSDERVRPEPVPGLDGVVAVAAGLVRNVALKADGSVWTWGELDRPNPAPVAGLGPMTAIAGGGLLSGAVAADGTVWTWGLDVGGSPTTPAQVDDLANVVAIDIGLESNLALLADGTVWEWRQFGDPRQIPAPLAATPTP